MKFPECCSFTEHIKNSPIKDVVTLDEFLASRKEIVQPAEGHPAVEGADSTITSSEPEVKQEEELEDKPPGEDTEPDVPPGEQPSKEAASDVSL